MAIRFNIPPRAGRELEYIQEAIENGRLAGNGPFTRRCQVELQKLTGAGKVLLTPSCTDALEMAAILANVKPGDEVIMPSYTFVSTANAFVLRGATPVFVDIEPQTMTIDPVQVASAVTPKTKAIVPVHYAGIGCDMESLCQIAGEAGACVIEDAAQGVMSTMNGVPLGSIGSLGTLSFHETKNLVCGEGGALLINDPDLFDRAEVIWEKGTDRSRFFRGEVDKYTWVDIGSSYLPSELQAAFLLAQIESAQEFTDRRMAAWERYRVNLLQLEQAGQLRLPVVPGYSRHNAHMFYILLNSEKERDQVLQSLNAAGINAVFHYQPLHRAPAGKRYGRSQGVLSVTDRLSGRLVRLPMFADLSSDQVDAVCSIVESAITGSS